MKKLKSAALVMCMFLLGACAGMQMAPVTDINDSIALTEISAQELQASIDNLVCTKFSAGACIEPGKALMPGDAAKAFNEIERVRGALALTAGIGDGAVGICLGAQRTAADCLRAAQLLLQEVETQYVIN